MSKKIVAFAIKYTEGQYLTVKNSYFDLKVEIKIYLFSLLFCILILYFNLKGTHSIFFLALLEIPCRETFV